MVRFNGKPDLTAKQIQHRSEKHRNRLKMRGLLTPKGRKPRYSKIEGDPIFKPVGPKPVLVSDMTHLLSMLMPPLLRRRRIGNVKSPK